MRTREQRQEFVQQLTGCQQRVFSFLLTLIRDVDQAREVLQETNLLLLHKAEQGEPIRNFKAFAVEVARFKAMAYLRDTRRDRHLFDPELLELIAEDAARDWEGADERMSALAECLRRLKPPHRDLIERRYMNDQSVQGIAQAIHRPVGSVSQALYRIRRALMQCIERRLASSS